MHQPKRIDRARSFLLDSGLAAMVIDRPVDLYYLTGLDLSTGRLYLGIEKTVLFVDGRYLEMCEKKAPVSVCLTKGYGRESAFGKMLYGSKKVAFDSLATSYHQYCQLSSLFRGLVPLENPLKKLRAIKDGGEIKSLKKAAKLNVKGFEWVCSRLQEGVSEKELAASLEIFWKQVGGEKVAFEPIIAFGAHSSLPHHHPSDRKLRRQDHVLMDFGVVVDHYHSDMTRVRFLGKMKKEMETIYFIVQEAQQRALSLCRPGMRVGEIDRAARGWIEKEGYGMYFPHSLGHGIGLEIHEYPTIRNSGEDAEVLLEEGMAITIEPGIYLPGKGGIRLEDMIVITSEGFQYL